MKTLIVALAVGAAVLTCGAVEAKEWKKISFGVEGAYAPWNATDASGNLVGFEIDLAKDLCTRMDVECTFMTQEWDDNIPALQQGKFDVILSGMTITTERQKDLTFSIPYAAEPTSFVTSKSSSLAALPQTDFLDLDTASGKKAVEDLAKALNGKTIGVQIATTQADFLEIQLPKIAVRVYDKIDDAGIDMGARRIDAMIGDRSAIETLIKDNKSGDIVLFGPNLVRGMLGEGMGMGMRKQDTDLKAMLDKAITEANKDGVITRLSNQHFGYDVSIKQ